MFSLEESGLGFQFITDIKNFGELPSGHKLSQTLTLGVINFRRFDQSERLCPQNFRFFIFTNFYSISGHFWAEIMIFWRKMAIREFSNSVIRES